MKTNRLQILDTFPYYHPLNGMPTCYKQSILEGKKIHTIRNQKPIYEEIKKEIDKGNTSIQLWQYDKVPDGSGVDTFITMQNCHYTNLQKINGQWSVGEYLLPIKEITLAINEGLTLQNFKGLWPFDDYENLTLFYFTEFDYEDELDKSLYPMDNIEEKKPALKIKFEATLFMGDVIVKRKQHFER